jgi:hypothetical protein
LSIEWIMTIVLGVAVVGLAAWMTVLQVRFSRLRRQYRRMMSGVEGANLEQALADHVDRVQQACTSVSELQMETQRIDQTLKHTMQWTGIVRFNPFRYTGGDQSFAWAIADSEGNGVVLSSLHARDQTRVYAKPLRNWESQYSLTEEEQEAITRARPAQA